MKNRVLPMLLCCALICSMMAMPQTHIQEPAHAEVVALTAGGIAIVLTLLAACGVTFATTDIGKKCVEQFANDVPDVKTNAAAILAASPAGRTLVITATTFAYVKKLVKEAVDYFKGKTAISIPESGSVYFQNIKMYLDNGTFTKQSTESDSDFAHRIYSLASYGVSDVITFENIHMHNDTGATNCSFSCAQSSSNFALHNAIASDGGSMRTIYSLSNIDSSYVFKYCFVVNKLSDTLYQFSPYLTYYSSSGYRYCKLDDIVSSIVQCNPADLTVGRTSASVNTADLNNDVDVNEAIAHGVGKSADGTITADIGDLIDKINEGIASEGITAETAQELLGIRDELRELEREQERTRDAIKEATQEDDMKVPQLGSSITDKFPFCVPFDLIALVKTFSAEPVAPKVTIPVVFQSMNYSHDFVFDFSGDNWDKVAAVIRWGTLIFFILGLTLITRNIIKG